MDIKVTSIFKNKMSALYSEHQSYLLIYNI